MKHILNAVLAVALSFIPGWAAWMTPLDWLKPWEQAVCPSHFFGRNFDWGTCTTLIVQTKPKNSYASISTVNLGFCSSASEQSASVEEALDLLRQYDFHASMGMMIHLALADTTGQAVVVEYIDNEMVVTEPPVVTNFYLAEGPKQGTGTQQSHTRYYAEWAGGSSTVAGPG